MSINIIESYKWLTPEFTITPTDGKTVKIRGKAIPRETISRNNRKYVDEELRRAARTFIDVPITENHKNWLDKKNHLGKVNWMEYDDGSMEYVAEVWNPSMAAELRAYAKNPRGSHIKGVSVEADFLKIACTRCQQEFCSESDWRCHMSEVEHIHDLPLEPHGIRGRALSIVTGKESPGVFGNTLEVLETVNPLFKLLEIVICKNREKENMSLKNKINVPSYIKEQVTVKKVEDEEEVKEEEKKEEPEITKEKEDEEDDDEKEEKDDEEEELLETVKIKPYQKIKEAAPRLRLGEPFSGYSSFEDCVEKNSEKENPEAYCSSMKNSAEETLGFQNGMAAKMNEVIEAFNSLKIPRDDKSWKQQFKRVRESIAKTDLIVASIKPYDDEEVKELINAVPKDEWKQPLEEAIGSIKPYDDSTLKTTLETLSQTLRENLDQTTQKTQLLETKLTTLETESKTLKETLEAQQKESKQVKESFEKLLEHADQNISMVKKSLEEREKELAETKKSLAETKTIAETAKIEAENANDKHQPKFKGSAKETVSKEVLPSSFNPYSFSKK
jgi:hypothetical protein